MNIPESLEEIQKLVANCELSLVQICKEYIQRIKSSKTNAFIEIFEEESLKKAEEVQAKIINKNSGLLAGMFMGLKDNICYKDHSVTASSKILKGFKSTFSASAVNKILYKTELLLEDLIVMNLLWKL